jgi:hypothetical protein
MLSLLTRSMDLLLASVGEWDDVPAIHRSSLLLGEVGYGCDDFRSAKWISVAISLSVCITNDFDDGEASSIGKWAIRDMFPVRTAASRRA